MRVIDRLRTRLTYANVMATIAVFAVLAGGAAYAGSLIGPRDIARDAVHSKHIRAGSVKNSDLADGVVTSSKLAGDSVGPDQVADPDRSVNLPLASFVNDTDSTTLDFGPNPDNGTTPNFAIVGSKLVIEWNDNSAGPADRDSVETGFAVPADYASGGHFVVRISKDGTDDIERVVCSAAVNQGGFSAGANSEHAITDAPITAYTLTPSGAGFVEGFAAGDAASFRCTIDDGVSGTTAQDRVRLHSAAFVYKAAQ
jgi:hypothetical protein